MNKEKIKKKIEKWNDLYNYHLDNISSTEIDKIIFDAIQLTEKSKAKEIFDDIASEVRVLKRRYKKIPMNLHLFLVDLNNLKKKHLGDKI